MTRKSSLQSDGEITLAINEAEEDEINQKSADKLSIIDSMEPKKRGSHDLSTFIGKSTSVGDGLNQSKP